MLLDEDRWNVEKEERQGRLAMDKQEAERRVQEQGQLQQMLQQDADLLGQVSIEEDGPLQ